MQNTKKISFEALKNIAKEFCKAEGENQKNELLKPLSSSQLRRLATLFYNLPNQIGYGHSLYILTIANHRAYYENQKRKAEKFTKKFKNMLK